MANYNEINEARRLLRLGQAATLKEIKNAYRRLAHQYHPDNKDVFNHENHETMKKLNLAYRLLLDYCDSYKYSFEEEDVARVYPEEEGYRNWREKWADSV